MIFFWTKPFVAFCEWFCPSLTIFQKGFELKSRGRQSKSNRASCLIFSFCTFLYIYTDSFKNCLRKYLEMSRLISFSDIRNSCWQPELLGWNQSTIPKILIWFASLFLEGCPCKNPFRRPCIPWVKNDSCPTNKCTMLVQLWL